MLEEIKCPNCGGNKFNPENEDVYKCSYCGCLIKYNEEKKSPREVVEETVTCIEQTSIQKEEIFSVKELWSEWTKTEKILISIVVAYFLFCIIGFFFNLN